MRIATRPGVFDLSPRETDCAQLVCLGLGDKQIAKNLGVSPKTVRVHLNHAYSKLNVQNRTQLALLMLKEGKMRPASPLTEREKLELY